MIAEIPGTLHLYDHDTGMTNACPWKELMESHTNLGIEINPAGDLKEKCKVICKCLVETVGQTEASNISYRYISTVYTTKMLMVMTYSGTAFLTK